MRDPNPMPPIGAIQTTPYVIVLCFLVLAAGFYFTR